jgi:tRNA threonylcarbamoyladenosine biosynthesis protein TsaE
LLADTLKLGEAVARACRGGEVFELISDLGGGKTAFVRGMANGIETEDDVSSPSFTINNTYKGGTYTLEHFDFYRLDEAGVVADELSEDMYTPNTIVVVEWGDIVHGVLPAHTIRVQITPQESEARIFMFSYQPSLAYLFQEIKS